MQVGKGMLEGWKYYVIGILVVVIVLVVLFYKPGILLSPGDTEEGIGVTSEEEKPRIICCGTKMKDNKIQAVPTNWCETMNDIIDTNVKRCTDKSKPFTDKCKPFIIPGNEPGVCREDLDLATTEK
jgi:hypothetical protein